MEIYKTDWLASTPIFYNENTLQISHCINDVIDWEHLKFHSEGLYNYLKFGYSVMGQTPIEGVKFLPPNTELTIEDNEFKIKYLEDPCIRLLEQKAYTEDDVVDMLKHSINAWMKDKDQIVVPTSGGYDSRLLNALVEDKSKLHAFSYGASSKHPEVIKAAHVCRTLGIDWNYIEIGYFHHYFNQWDNIFGISTHAHGMYHMEFYQKIRDMGYQNIPLLSGIVGDAWAGSISVTDIKNVSDIEKLGYTHGMNADPTQLLLKSDYYVTEKYLTEKQEILCNPLMRVIETIRFKIILLNYLITVPEHMGFEPWSPFLDLDVAIAMLKLPTDRRKNRIWQSELFEKLGLNVEKANLKSSRKGHINLNAMRKVPLRPLDEKLLGEIINPAYIEWINRTLQTNNTWNNFYDDCMHTPYLKEILKKLGLKNKRMDAYCAYLTLKPIENMLIKRNGKVLK